MMLHRAKASNTSKMSVSRTQVRHFWPFNRRLDWSSHLDPQFARYQRQRSINTRAKLLKSIRRRNKWDFGDNCFFTPKHIRLASHYYGRGNRARWLRETEQEDGKIDNDGHELTEKEKYWKEQIQRMRNRIERDPYEAVFGKRVEPFWEGLMPNWMRDELGLPKKDTESAKTDAKKDTSKPDYAYSSQTSWDSWTNKVRKSEWDSNTGAKHYEYDPISNRMVQIEEQAKQVEKLVENKAAAAEVKPEPKAERKAIPIPQFAEPATDTVTHVTPASEIDGLTANNIRASMGKPKSQDHHQIAALLQEGAPKKSASSHFDHAETYYMLEQQLQSLQLQRDNLAKNESRLYHFGELARRYQRLEGEILILTKKLESMNREQIQEATGEAKSAPLKTALERGATAKSLDKPLRPAVERMQSKPALTAVDLDDSAAHESTEPVATVPKAWSKQADLLQADRVKRTAGKSTAPFPPSWVASTEVPKEAVKPVELSASTKLLNAEVDRMVEAMDTHETPRAAREHDATPDVPIRKVTSKHDSVEKELTSKIVELEAIQEKHKTKIAALKNELDIAYKQSSRHADEFRDQISKAEQRSENAKVLEQKYKAKIASLKEDLDIAFKQSSVQADEFRDHIKKAEAQLEARIKADEHMRKITADHEANVEAASRLAKAEQQLKAMSKAMAEQEESKRALEKRAKAIEVNKPAKSMHRQLLDERFARYKAACHVPKTVGQPDFNEIKHAYRFKPDNLEAELCSGKPVESSVKTYHFKKDNLEAELAGKDKASAHSKDVLKARRAVNPVDGTTAPTGNYASPTGFVNFDPVVPLKAKSPSSANLDKARIKRQETVFSGTKRVHDRYERREFRHSYRRRRARFRRFVKFATIAGGLAATVAYVQGTSMEQKEIRLQASQEVYKKMAEQYEKKGEQGLVQAVQENVQKSGGYFWK